ncbi:hypothetical protein AB4Y45_34735 [Paraburkholderia sp. EG287A]|uniref:hypothetical protein n=1 Tax=Paraburkholderia sp. EG287A TaxID=3237012 RepID=UPI0034D37074
MTFQQDGLLTIESLRAFRAAFRRLANARKLTAQHMALHAIIMGKPLNRAFSPITNATKLANGRNPWDGAASAIAGLAHSPDAACVAAFEADTLELARALARQALPAIMKMEA